MAQIATFPQPEPPVVDHDLPLALQDIERARSTFMAVIARCDSVSDCLKMRKLIRGAVERLDDAASVALERAGRLTD